MNKAACKNKKCPEFDIEKEIPDFVEESTCGSCNTACNIVRPEKKEKRLRK